MQISDFGLLDPDGDPDRHQNWTHWSLPLQEFSSKSFLHNEKSQLTLTNPHDAWNLGHGSLKGKHGYLAANSNYHYLKHLLSISFTCKFHRATFTAFHCLQITTIRLCRQSPLHANSETADLLPKSITGRFNYLHIHATPTNKWPWRP